MALTWLRALALSNCLLFSATLDFQRAFQGNGTTNINAITSDTGGNVYIAGSTSSFDLPVTNAFQSQNRGSAVIVSEDGGQTWSPSGYLPNGYADQLIRLPLPAPVLLAINFYGLYRSTDDARTWQTVLDLKTDRRIGFVNTLDYDRRNPSVVYASANSGVLKSTDAGSHWTLLTSGLTPVVCCLGSAVSVDPFRPGRIYYSLQNVLGLSGRAYVSNDFGATWNPLNVPENFSSPRVIADPVIADAAYLYGVGAAYHSSDGGVSWQRLPLRVTDYLSWIVPDATVAGRVYAKTNDAILRSDDSGMTWRVLSVPGLDPRSGGTILAVQPGRPDFVIVSSSTNLYSTDAGQTWQSLNLNRQLYGFEFDAANPKRLYAAGPVTSDAFIAKLTPSGEIVFLTYLGGQGNDAANSIAVDADALAHVPWQRVPGRKI